MKIALLLPLCLFIVSCGGGGDSSGGGTTPIPDPVILPPTASEKIKNAKDYTAQELETAATTLVNDNFTGAKTNAQIDIEVAQQAFLYLFYDTVTEIPSLVNESLESLPDSAGNVDIRVMCDVQGSVDYKGQLNDQYQGNLSANYNNCYQYENDFPISGSIAATIHEITDNSVNLTYYYDGLSWRADDKTVNLYGYSHIEQGIKDDGKIGVNSYQNVLIETSENLQLMLDATMTFNNINAYDLIESSGDLYIGNQGKVSYTFEDIYDFPPYFNSGKVRLEGDKTAAFEFEYPYIRYVEDANNDGSYDIGAYFFDIYELLNSTAKDKQLIALSELSLPPSVSGPYVVHNQNYNATTPIEVTPGYFSDPDTPQEQLIISYRWYLNDVLIEGQNGDTLPAYIAVYGDKLEVTMVVSDGANVIESLRVSIILQDSPAQIDIAHLPEVVTAGQIVTFTVNVTDPDVGAIGNAGELISGPENASINEDGEVTWNVPTDLLFSHQQYHFTFGLADSDENYNDSMTVAIVATSTKELPLARTGMEVPKNNKSMAVGDFDGDGKNEVLSTDGQSTVFLLEYNGLSYQQKWVYPYKVANEGRILQVLSANIDQDDEDEIIVVSEKGISLIDGLQSLAVELMSFKDILYFATIQDIDNDGIKELAYLYSDSAYSDEKQLNVVSLANVEDSLFTTSVSNAAQIAFANVDEDENIELVLNNGLVYDAITWENQWFSGTSFGNSSVTTGDYDGDGIDEIAGADTWGSITVYSADDKTQLDSFDNFNTCTLNSADVNSDGIDELLVGDCQWGNISAYQLANSSLSVLWQVDMHGHGSVSLTVGDSDNDDELEVHWGTGISSSGEDSFVVADILSSSAKVKEQAIEIQLGAYSSAGWSHIINDEEKAVFFIPSTNSGYDGSRLAMLSSDGEMSLSNEISSNWDGSRYALTNDFNNDGLGDIFLPATHLYDGSFAAMQIHDESIHWQTSGDYDSSIGVIKSVDVNEDGHDDAVYADGAIIKAIDVQNQTILGNYTFDSYIKDFDAYVVDGVASIIVAHDEKLSFLTKNGAAFAEQSFVEERCSRVLLTNFDTDDDKELVCLQTESAYSNNNQQLVVFDLDDASFTEISRTDLEMNVIDIVIDPSTDNEQSLMITIQSNTYSYYDENSSYFVMKTTPKGEVIWSSLELVGKPTNHGLKVRKQSDDKLELLLSTSKMMYWIQ